MDSVASKLQEWGFASLIEIFQAHQIDEEALLLLDKESIRALVPQIGLCVKLQKRISDYRTQFQQDCTPEVLLLSDAGKEAAICEVLFKVEPSSPLISSQPSESFRPTATKFDVVTVVMDKCQEIGDTLKSSPISYLENLKLSRAVGNN